jgi:hypothetical protein
MCFMPVTDPKTVKNRVHLDLTSSAADRDQEIDRLLALGARRVAGRRQPGHRVRDLVLGGQPFEELLQGPVLVAGVRAAVAVQQPEDPPLDIGLADLFPAGQAGLPAQVLTGEPLHRLGIGPHRLGGLPLGGGAGGTS